MYTCIGTANVQMYIIKMERSKEVQVDSTYQPKRSAGKLGPLIAAGYNK